jgi:hypothetical protein
MTEQATVPSDIGGHMVSRNVIRNLSGGDGQFEDPQRLALLCAPDLRRRAKRW